MRQFFVNDCPYAVYSVSTFLPTCAQLRVEFPEMEKQKGTVSFRLAPEFLKLLNDEATKEGKSTGDCARRFLIRALTDTERSELREELEKLRTDFRKMREDWATLSHVLLVKVAKEKPEVAEAWVRENLAP